MKFHSIRLLLIILIVALTSCADNASSSEEATWKYLSSSIEYKNQATQIINAGPSPAAIESEVMGEMKHLWQQALKEARKVDISVLNADEPDFGNRYKNEFQRGLELVIKAQSNDELIRGQLLLIKFGEYMENLLARKRSVTD